MMKEILLTIRSLLIALSLSSSSLPLAWGEDTAGLAPAKAYDELVTLIDGKDLAGACIRVQKLRKDYPKDDRMAIAETKIKGLLLQALVEAHRVETKRVRLSAAQLPVIEQLSFEIYQNRARELMARGMEGNPGDLIKLLGDVKEMMVRQPDFLAGWILQAHLALVLNRMPEGFTAAFNMKELGALESTSQEVQRLITLLNERGWWPAQPKPRKS